MTISDIGVDQILSTWLFLSFINGNHDLGTLLCRSHVSNSRRAVSHHSKLQCCIKLNFRYSGGTTTWAWTRAPRAAPLRRSEVAPSVWHRRRWRRRDRLRPLWSNSRCSGAGLGRSRPSPRRRRARLGKPPVNLIWWKWHCTGIAKRVVPSFGELS